MSIGTKMAIAAIAALTIVSGTLTATRQADARPFGGIHGGAFHGGFNRGYGFGHRGFYGPRFGFGLYGYPYYASYGYGDCFIKHRVFLDRFGYRYIRPIRVCV